VKATTFIIVKIKVLNLRRHCLLILLVKVDRRDARGPGSYTYKVMVSLLSVLNLQ
jgi:hypothetical protein